MTLLFKFATYNKYISDAVEAWDDKFKYNKREELRFLIDTRVSALQ